LYSLQWPLLHYIFKSQIVAYVKKEINKNLNAKVDFKEVDISLAPNVAKDELTKQLGGDKNAAADSTKTKPGPKGSLKGLMNNLLKKKVKDTAAKQ
jgi:hypothetical protein